MEDLTVEQVKAIHNRVMVGEKGDCRILSEANLHQMSSMQTSYQTACNGQRSSFIHSVHTPAFSEGNSAAALAATEQVLATGGYRIKGKRAGIMVLAEGILAFTTEP